MAASFAPFKPKVRYSWDENFFYEESDNMPDGMPNKMVGITAWQQQIPLPASYFAGTTNQEKDPASMGYGQPNYWRLPLTPTPSASPIPISAGNFQRGAVALAANGIAIFNPKNNRGEVAYEIGELDAYGGHCGMGDDYHYHIIPTHLLSAFGGVLTNDKPVAWALDGYPIYGFVEPDGTSRAPLDADGGHDTGNGWGYHYHAIGTPTTDATHPYGTHQSPYLMSAFHGTVVNYGGQVDGQPQVAAIRADGTGGYSAAAVSGASIIAFKNPVALSVDGSGNLSENTSSSAVTSADQFLMRTLINGTTYDQCWRINRSAIAKTLTITWRMPGASPITTTYNNNNDRFTSYALNGPSILKLPDTSQTADTTTSFGEDADYSINPQSFTDNNNGTVTDNVTGLMWQKTDNGESTWETALLNASTLALGGHTDWRLPTPAELFTIFNHNIGNPAALDATFFPSNPTGAAQYWWSSDVYGSSTTTVWCANAVGGLGGKPKTETLSALGSFRYHARYVRGAKPSNTHNYLNTLDGTVTDLDTGLMWTQLPATARTWEQALTYAEGLTLAGASDWRLPNIQELQTLTDYTLATATAATGVKPSINRTVFAKVLSNCATTVGSTTVTCSDTTGLLVGMPLVDVVNAGGLYLASTVPPTVTAITGGTSFTISSNALKSGAGLTLKALAPPTAYWSSTSLQGDTTKAWLLEAGINTSVPATNGPPRNGQGIISYEAKTSSYPVFAVRTTSVSSQIGVFQDAIPLTDGVSSVRFSSLGSKSFTILNNGTTSLVLNGISIDGSDSGQFSVSNAPASGTTMSSGDSITFSVNYGATSSGVTHSAVLRVASSDPTPGTAFDIPLSGSLPVITDVRSNSSAPTSSDSPYVTAKISAPSDKTLRSTTPVQLTYIGATLATNTVFSETMAKAAYSAWDGSNADNLWTLNARGSDHIQQSTAANHSTQVDAGTNGLSMTKGSLAFSDTQATSVVINAAGLTGSTNPAYAEFYLQTPATNSGTYGWTFQLAPNGTDFVTRLSETTINGVSTGTLSNGTLSAGKHGWLQYHYDLSDAERVSTLKMRFQFIGGNLATSSVHIDDIVVKTTNLSPLTLTMYDDGLHGDGTGGDGVYGAQIPPQAAGTQVRFSVAVNFSDGSSSSLVDAGSYTTTAPVLITSDTSLPETISGAPYAQTLAASGGLSNYVWSRSGGSIPPGLTLSNLGVLSGTATAAGTFSFTVTAADSAGNAASKAFALSVNAPLTFTTQPAGLTVNAGSLATFSVSVAGTGPFSYQWRKDGVPIVGATLSTYTLASIQGINAGTYDVLVSNVAGSATSASATLAVNTAPVINSQPASLTVNAGTVATFTVTVSGTAPLSYQWRKDGAPLSNGTSATYSVVAQQATVGSYDVVVSNVVTSITSAPASLSILKFPTLSQTINGFRMLKGSLATLSLSLESQIPGASDSWQLMRVGSTLPVLSGTVTAGGGFLVPLRYITDEGDYFIRTTRTYADGSDTSYSDSLPFRIQLLAWDSVAGSYDALLADLTHIPSDGAAYRGVVGFSVNRYGTASGRLRFSEPLSIPNAPDPSFRNYTPVVRTFVKAFTPVEGNPSLVQLTSNLGVGAVAGRETLVLQLDLSTSPPTFSATVKISNLVVPDGGSISAMSGATECARQITSAATIPTEMRGAIGRYTLLADSSNLPTNQSYLALTATSSGMLVWASRRPGYSGSGSNALSVESKTSFGAKIYESQVRAVPSTSSILTRISLGKLNLAKTDLGGWRAAVNSGTDTRALELQSCCLTVIGGLVSYKSENANWSKIQSIGFSEGAGGYWSLQSSAIPLLHPPSRMLFSLQPPQVDPSIRPVDVFWNVAFSTTASATFERTAFGGTTLLTMTGALNRSTGSWLGTYIPPGGSLRYRVYGAVLSPLDTNPEVARGWVESGLAPFLSVGTWSLQNVNAP